MRVGAARVGGPWRASGGSKGAEGAVEGAEAREPK